MRDNQTENPTTNTENKEYKNEVREAITGAKQDTFDLYADIQKFNRTLKKGVE